MKLDWLKTHRGVAAGVAGAAILVAIGGGVAFAVDGGTGHTGTPPHPATIAVDAQGYEHVCVNQFPPYEVMRGNLTDTCLAGYLPSKVATGQVAQGPKGDPGQPGIPGRNGLPGPIGPAGPAGKDGSNGFLSWGHGDIGEPQTPLEHIGGPIRTNGTAMGTLTNLDPGVYQLFINSSFTRTAAASATDSDTYPVMTAWEETAGQSTWAADFSNTVITINGGRMSRGKTIDQTVNGSALITIHSTSDVIHFVAFAYDEDAGSSGSVQVDNGVYSAIQLDSNPAHGG